MRFMEKEIKVQIKTGPDTWAFITGSLEFVKQAVENCYLLAKTRWADSPTYIISSDLDSRIIKTIKRKVEKEIRQAHRKDKR